MAVEIDSSRKAVNIKWNPDAIDSDEVDVHAANVATGDRSERTSLPNDGYAVLTYPVDFTGTSHVAVVAAGAEPPETGEIEPGSEEGEVGATAASTEGVEQGEIEVT